MNPNSRGPFPIDFKAGDTVVFWRNRRLVRATLSPDGWTYCSEAVDGFLRELSLNAVGRFLLRVCMKH